MWRPVEKTHVLDRCVETFCNGVAHTTLCPEEAVGQSTCTVNSYQECIFWFRILNTNRRERKILPTACRFDRRDLIGMLPHCR